jgi:hypothetical protein
MPVFVVYIQKEIMSDGLGYQDVAGGFGEVNG